MSSPTKIVVIPRKHLIIGAVAAAVIIVLIIIAVFSLGNDSHNTSAKPYNTSSTSAKTSSDTVKSNNVNTYTPGVYTSSLSLNGNPVDIQVTVDKTNINSIDMINVSDSITTMYPMIETAFNELANSVIEHGGTENISYNSDNKYTATLILNAIQEALDKCTVH